MKELGMQVGFLVQRNVWEQFTMHLYTRTRFKEQRRKHVPTIQHVAIIFLQVNDLVK